jgi:hypothetical protein
VCRGSISATATCMASEKAKDVELAKKLWDLSVELTT